MRGDGEGKYMRGDGEGKYRYCMRWDGEKLKMYNFSDYIRELMIITRRETQ